MNILKKKNINDIVIGEDDILLPFYNDDLSNRLNDQLENIDLMVGRLEGMEKLIKEYGGKFLFVGVPGQSSFYSDKYPFYMDNKEEYFKENENVFFGKLQEKDIDFLNMNEIFRDNYREDYYLKTDHHYSFEGFFKTYREIMKSLDIKPLDKTDFDIQEIKKPILGSRNRTIYYLKDTTEKFKVPYLKDEIEYTKYTKGVEDRTLYYINEDRPSYMIYMGGDHAETVIDTHRSHLPNLLIFGDSFTNAIEPLMFLHFNKTRILDLRHYKDMELQEYIKTHQPDYVVMVRDDLNYGNLEGNGDF